MLSAVFCFNFGADTGTCVGAGTCTGTDIGVGTILRICVGEDVDVGVITVEFGWIQLK